jgi:hypothetical protein
MKSAAQYLCQLCAIFIVVLWLGHCCCRQSESLTAIDLASCRPSYCNSLTAPESLQVSAHDLSMYLTAVEYVSRLTASKSLQMISPSLLLPSRPFPGASLWSLHCLARKARPAMHRILGLVVPDWSY